MYGPDWEEGCPSCSFWADNYDRVIVHLNHRDITMLAISNAPAENLHAYRERMNWSFKWLSAMGNDCNRDYNVSFSSEEMTSEKMAYNFPRRASLPQRDQD